MDFWEDLFDLLDHSVVGHHIVVEVQEPSLVGRVQDVRHAVEGMFLPRSLTRLWREASNALITSLVVFDDAGNFLLRLMMPILQR